MRRFWLVAAWLALAALVTTATWQVVGAAQDRVAEDPLAPIVALTLPPDTTGPVETIPVGGPASPLPGQSTTTVTSEATVRPPTTVTTSPAATPATAPTGSATIPSPGGTVVVSFSGSEVTLQAVTPAIGFTADVEHAGPDQVRIEFESGQADVRVRARMEGGRLVTEVSTDHDDSGDD